MSDEWPGSTGSLADRLRSLQGVEERKLGFPGWSSPFPDELLPFFSYELNQYGDPMIDPIFPWHVKDLERELVDGLADLFAAPAGDRWGYVTSGSSEGILYGLWLGRTLHPTAGIYHSRAAHPCVPKNIQLLDRQGVEVPTDARGEMDYEGLRELIAQRRDPAAIVLATIGTTLTEAVDDVARIRRVMRESGVLGHYIHADGALSALPLALSVPAPPAFGLHRAGVDSISISGHKFLGAPFPCGVVLTRATRQACVPRTCEYTGSAAPTISSSRSGHSTLLLWHRMQTLGVIGLRRLARQARQMAAYAERSLQDIGWQAWRAHPHACTVVLDTPPPAVLDRWPLATFGTLSHLVCTPAVTRERITRFVAELRLAVRSRRVAAADGA